MGPTALSVGWPVAVSRDSHVISAQLEHIASHIDSSIEQVPNVLLGVGVCPDSRVQGDLGLALTV